MSWDSADRQFQAILKRPSMYGVVTPSGLQHLLVILLAQQCLVLDAIGVCDPRRTLFRVYQERYGKPAGAAGPAVALATEHNLRRVDDPEVLAFFQAFTDACLAELAPFKAAKVAH